MELIVRPRKAGKTTEMIQRAAEERATIVCLTKKEASRIFHQARDMGLDIKFPLSAEEFHHGDFYPPGCHGGFIFDNLDAMLRQWARGVTVKAVTWTADDEAQPG